VIPIYDMGSQDGLLYIAMRYVAGTDLRQMIKKRGRLQPETALFLLGQAARALDAAHRQALVHRDAKPGNLLIERGSDEGDPEHAYLTDFGISKHAMSRTGLTSTGQFLGTVDYVAPEQIRGLPLTGQADQYSLGCAVRVPDRPGSVREGPGRGDHLGACRGDADQAHGAAPGHAARSGRGIRPGAGQAAR
jgi:serine/threonine protein kinase